MTETEPIAYVARRMGRKEARALRAALPYGADLLAFVTEGEVDVPSIQPIPRPRSYDEIQKLADRCFDAFVVGCAPLIWAQGLLGGDAHYAFRRELFLKTIGVLSFLEGLNASASKGRVILLTSRNWRPEFQWPVFFLDILREMKARPPAPDFGPLLGRLEIPKDSALPFLVDVARSLLFLLCRFRLFRRVQERPLAIRAYRDTYGFFEQTIGLRHLALAEDEERFPPRSIAFWAESDVPTKDLKLMRRRGYAVASAHPLAMTPGLKPIAWISALARFTALVGRARGSQARLCLELFRAHVQARAFAGRYKPRHLLLYNDLTAGAVARTITLRQAGCRSVFYQHSSQLCLDRQEPEFAHLYFDVFATWGPAMTEYYRRHAVPPAEFWEVGCFWSENVRRLREEPSVASDFREKIKAVTGKTVPHRESVVAVFDTTVNRYLFDVEDCLVFWRHVVSLSEEFPAMTFLFKPKNKVHELPPETRAGFEAVGRAARGRPNLILLDAQMDSAVAAGFSARTISACFSSTLLESLGSGTPAVYFDPRGRLRDSADGLVKFWAAYPGLILHGADALSLWLKGSVRPTEGLEALALHMDGRAISRLRARLTGQPMAAAS